MVGRPPKLDEIKALQGNPGKRPLAGPSVDGSPAISTQMPPPPFLREGGERDLWNSIGRHLAGLSFLKTTDHGALGRWCKYMHQWIEVSKKIEADDLTYETESKHGKLKRVRPEFLVQGLLEKRICALEDRLGLTPISRQQIIRALALVTPQSAGDLFERDVPSRSDAPAPKPAGSGPVGMLAGSSKLN